jgi:hypothetical protein
MSSEEDQIRAAILDYQNQLNNQTEQRFITSIQSKITKLIESLQRVKDKKAKLESKPQGNRGGRKSKRLRKFKSRSKKSGRNTKYKKRY